MIKMLLIGYLYGIKSERRLAEDVALNLAYRWFCGFDLNDKIPAHSLFSQNRRRRFTDSQIFNEIFNHIVRICIEKGLGYLTEMTTDTENGIVLGVDCYPANKRESDIILKHIDKKTQGLTLMNLHLSSVIISELYTEDLKYSVLRTM